MLLCSVQALPYYSAELGQDAIRDLLVSERIARESFFPLAGPGFNLGSFALGPIWFYVLSLPSWLGVSPAGTAFFVGILASLKIPLAFQLGLLLAGRGLAWCLVAAISWPSVQAYQWFWWSSPNVVETCLWGYASTVAVALRATPPRAIHWLAPASLLSLAVHAHPTALLYVPTIFAAWLVWARGIRRDRRRKTRSLASLAIAAAFLVWFAPTLMSRDGSPSNVAESPLHALFAYAAAALERLWQLGPVLVNLLWRYPIAAWQTWQPAPVVSEPTVAMAVAFWLAAITAGVLVSVIPRSDPSRSRLRTVREWLAVAAVLAAIGLPIVAILRPWVAYYTLFSVMPALNGVQGGALWMLGTRPGSGSTWATSLAVAFSLAGSLWLGFGAARVNEAGIANLPLATLGNLLLGPAASPDETVRVRQTPKASEQITRWLCENDVQTVHGTVGLGMAADHGLFHRRYCDSRAHPFILGQAGDRHAVGLPVEWLRLAERPPLFIVDGLGLAWVRAVPHPPQGSRPGSFTYFENAPDKLPAPIDLTLRFLVPADSAVLVTSLKPWGGTTRTRRVSRNGVDLPPAAESALGGIWLGTRSGEGAEVSNRPGSDEWRIEIRTDVPQWVDVVAF